MLDEPEIRIQIGKMKGTMARMAWALKRNLHFELEEATQLVRITIWRLLEQTSAAGWDSLVVLQQMAENRLDAEIYQSYKQIVTVQCAEWFQSEKHYLVTDPQTGQEKWRKVPPTGSLDENQASIAATEVFDINAYIGEVIDRLESPLERATAHQLIFRLTTIKKFRQTWDLKDSKKWRRLRDDVEVRLAIEFRRKEQELFGTREPRKPVPETSQPEPGPHLP